MARAEHKCQRCNELIIEVINKLRNYCVQNNCCWERDYEVSFPTNVCQFATRYKHILSSILKNDKLESKHARDTWNQCVRPNMEARNLCKKLGKCGDVVPDPRNHEVMVTWCNESYPKRFDQTTCWECIEENSDCGYSELNGICENMADCRGDSFLKILDNPNPELLQCLESFPNGDCCNPNKKKTTKGMTRIEKNSWWEEFTRTGEFPSR